MFPNRSAVSRQSLAKQLEGGTRRGQLLRQEFLPAEPQKVINARLNGIQTTATIPTAFEMRPRLVLLIAQQFTIEIGDQIVVIQMARNCAVIAIFGSHFSAQISLTPAPDKH